MNTPGYFPTAYFPPSYFPVTVNHTLPHPKWNQPGGYTPALYSRKRRPARRIFRGK